MVLKGKGKFLIVDVEEEGSETQGNITVVQSERPAFAIGRVVTSGPYVVVDEGAEVVISLEHAKPLGLGYPNTYRVVDGEVSLVAALEAEAEEKEDSDETG